MDQVRSLAVEEMAVVQKDLVLGQMAQELGNLAVDMVTERALVLPDHMALAEDIRSHQLELEHHMALLEEHKESYPK